MVFCPKIIKYIGDGVPETKGMDQFRADMTTWDSHTVEIMEECCKSLHRCDIQKRSELKNTLIEGNIRNCECEREFHTCFQTPKLFDLSGFEDKYSQFTPKCYSVDHPIMKCEEYQCYYHPSQTFYQYPSKHLQDAVRCVKYKLDESKPKIPQTFQIPLYLEYDSSSLLDLQASLHNDGNL